MLLKQTTRRRFLIAMSISEYCLDFETRSELDVRKVGAWVYATHASTDILCAAFCCLNPREQDPAMFTWRPGGSLEVFAPFFDESAIIHAHNAEFERAIWKHVMALKYGLPDIPIRQWRCSAAQAAYHAHPRKLENVAKALKLTQQKDMDGHKLMLKYTKPSKYGFLSNPQDEARIVEYCIDDVAAEVELTRTVPEMPWQEQLVWQLDQQINERGIPIDRESIQAIIDLHKIHKKRGADEMRRITNNAVQTPQQVAKILAWLESRGFPLSDLQRETVEWAINRAPDDRIRRVLELRLDLSKSSVAKYEKMLETEVAGRIKGSVLYFGAHTGRWSGRGFQPQNMPRKSLKSPGRDLEAAQSGDIDFLVSSYGSMAEFASTAIRNCIKAPEKRIFRAADFNAIEARVLFWLVKEESGLQAFREGRDPYKEMACDIYEIEIDKVGPAERQNGKNAVLGCGFQVGPATFYDRFCGPGDNMELAVRCVEAYRNKYKRVKGSWKLMGDKVLQVVKTGKAWRIYNTKWYMHRGYLVCQLPSGRHLHYPNARTRVQPAPWSTPERPRHLEVVSYDSQSLGGQVWTETTYGGKLIENVVQAIARDIMVNSMFNTESAGYETILTVHDEILSENDEDFGSLDEFLDLMAQPPLWAEDCPIKVEGWEGDRYQK